MRRSIAPLIALTALLLLPACEDTEPPERERAEEGPTAIPQNEALYESEAGDPEPGEPATSPTTNKVDEVQHEVAEEMMEEPQGEAAPEPQPAPSGAPEGAPEQEAPPAEAPGGQAPAEEAPAGAAAEPSAEPAEQPEAEAAAEPEAATEPEAAPEAEAPAPAGASQETLALGQQLWSKNCKGCHGMDGARTQMGSRTMADMSSDAWQQQATAAGIEQVIREGAPGMPGYASRLSEQEIEALVAYTQSL